MQSSHLDMACTSLIQMNLLFHLDRFYSQYWLQYCNIRLDRLCSFEPLQMLPQEHLYWRAWPRMLLKVFVTHPLDGKPICGRMEIRLECNFSTTYKYKVKKTGHENLVTDKQVISPWHDYSPMWKWIVVNIYGAAKRQGKYPPLSLTLRRITVLVYTTQTE